MATPILNDRSATRWKRRRQMAADRGHSLSSEKRLEKFYPDQYPEMVQMSPGVVSCREQDDEAFNRWLYEHRMELETLRVIS